MSRLRTSQHEDPAALRFGWDEDELFQIFTEGTDTEPVTRLITEEEFLEEKEKLRTAQDAGPEAR